MSTTRDHFIISKLENKLSILKKTKRDLKDEIRLPGIKYESQNNLSPAKSMESLGSLVVSSEAYGSASLEIHRGGMTKKESNRYLSRN